MDSAVYDDSGGFESSVTLEPDVAQPLCRAMMRVQAELLLEDADSLGSDAYEDRTHEQRAADALVRLAVRIRQQGQTSLTRRDCREIANPAIPVDQPAGPRRCDLGLLSALGGTRTPNLLIRSQMLSPIELRALGCGEATVSEGSAAGRPRFEQPMPLDRGSVVASRRAVALRPAVVGAAARGGPRRRAPPVRPHRVVRRAQRLPEQHRDRAHGAHRRGVARRAPRAGPAALAGGATGRVRRGGRRGAVDRRAPRLRRRDGRGGAARRGRRLDHHDPASRRRSIAHGIHDHDRGRGARWPFGWHPSTGSTTTLAARLCSTGSRTVRSSLGSRTSTSSRDRTTTCTWCRAPTRRASAEAPASTTCAATRARSTTTCRRHRRRRRGVDGAGVVRDLRRSGRRRHARLTTKPRSAVRGRISRVTDRGTRAADRRRRDRAMTSRAEPRVACASTPRGPRATSSGPGRRSSTTSPARPGTGRRRAAAPRPARGRRASSDARPGAR